MNTALDAGHAGSRFAAGTMISDRYRIVGLLGRGGMGEVYRADDLKLGQPVALKFLPGHLERDPLKLSRFLNEVRTALKVPSFSANAAPSDGMSLTGSAELNSVSGIRQLQLWRYSPALTRGCSP